MDVTIEELIEKYRKVTPGRQGHWRPQRLQAKRIRTQHKNAPRRLPTGKRRRRALVQANKRKNVRRQLLGKRDGTRPVASKPRPIARRPSTTKNKRIRPKPSRKNQLRRSMMRAQLRSSTFGFRKDDQVHELAKAYLSEEEANAIKEKVKKSGPRGRRRWSRRNSPLSRRRNRRAARAGSRRGISRHLKNNRMW